MSSRVVIFWGLVYFGFVLLALIGEATYAAFNPDDISAIFNNAMTSSPSAMGFQDFVNAPREVRVVEINTDNVVTTAVTAIGSGFTAGLSFISFGNAFIGAIISIVTLDFWFFNINSYTVLLRWFVFLIFVLPLMVGIVRFLTSLLGSLRGR
jgi:hypothetical protein